MKQIGERKAFYKVAERTYTDDLNRVRTLRWIGGCYKSKESAKRAIRKFKKTGDVLKKYDVDEMFYSQKATLVWKKDGKRHTKKITISSEVGNWWQQDTVFDYIKETYGDVEEIHWGEIC